MNDAAVTAKRLRRQAVDVKSCAVVTVNSLSVSVRRSGQLSYILCQPGEKRHSRAGPGASDHEANLDVRRRGHVNAVDEADLVRVVLHDDRAGPGAVAKEAHTAHQRAVGDARGGEDDLAAGSEVLR